MPVEPRRPLAEADYDDKDGRLLTYADDLNKTKKVLAPDANGLMTYVSFTTLLTVKKGY